MRDHNINQGSSSSLVPIEMEVTTEALNSSLQGKRHAIMILVNDLDLIAGFTNRHTAIRAPEMFDHASFADAKIPLRTRIFLGLRNRLLFLLQIPGREHPAWLLFGIARVNAGFLRRCPLVILVKDSRLLASFTNHEAAVRGADMLNYAILAEREKDLLLILHGYARRSILVSGRLLMFPLNQLSIAVYVQRGIPVPGALQSLYKRV